MPMGPKWPLNSASRRLLISGIHLYNPMMIGKRRSNNTGTAMDMRRPTERESSWSENELNGIQAPTYTNAAVLSSKSMTEEKTEASVCLLKKPSQANAVPQTKEARISSEPRILVVPTVRRASEIY